MGRHGTHVSSKVPSSVLAFQTYMKGKLHVSSRKNTDGKDDGTLAKRRSWTSAHSRTDYELGDERHKQNMIFSITKDEDETIRVQGI